MEATNHLPRIHGTDLGIWRRIRLVPFTQCIPPEKQDIQMCIRDSVISLRNDFIEHRNNYKAKFIQAKADYGKVCDSLRQAESLVQQAQANLDSRIDQLRIIAFGLPGFDEVMQTALESAAAEKK